MEAVASVRIHERREVFAGLTLYASLEQGEVGDVVAALESRTLLQVQMCAGLEEEGSGEIGSCGDDHRASSGSGRLVDHRLYPGGLEDGAVLPHAVFGDYVLGAFRLGRAALSGLEPALRPRSVRKLFHLLRRGHRQQYGEDGGAYLSDNQHIRYECLPLKQGRHYYSKR